jgi:predicted TIM-barrel fold metal-dependent hydrolase
VENPEGLGKGLWFIMEGLEPMRVGYFSLGHVVDKPEGRSNMSIYGDAEKFKELVSDFRENYRYEDYPEDWEPSAYCKALDRDNVEGMILFASWARYNYHLEDAKLQRSIFRSYNEWIMDFASHAPRRIFPAPMISILDIETAVEDMRHFVKRGARTVHLPTTIMGSGYWEPVYEPLWATAVELDIPLTVHANSSQGRSMKLHGMAKRKDDPRQYVIRSEFEGNRFGGPMAAWSFVSNLIFSGVFDRHPSLKVCCSEFQMADAATAYESINYTNRRWPSEYLRENVYMDFEDSRATVLTTPVYGEDNFYWSSDYPHFQTVWPRSASILEANCKGLAPDVVRKLGRDNVNQIYKLGLN